MLMSVDTFELGAATFPELAGHRVLLTGLTPASGVDVARAFADHKARLVLQTPEPTPEIDELAALLVETAAEVRLFTTDLADRAAALDFAKTAAQAFTGLDAAINIVTLRREDLAAAAGSERDIERLVATTLDRAAEMTAVLANRMRLTLGTGLVLNVLLAPADLGAREGALVGLVRAALAAMTRRLAEEWAPQAIRINAIAPRLRLPGDGPERACLTSEPDLAALALHLASRRGRQITGHVLDAEGVATLGC